MKNINRKNGFTLIELLAVIVILGVLLAIAIPKVSHYISNSRKDSFVSAGKLYIDSVRNDATSEIFPLPIHSDDVTIVTLDSVKLEKDQGDSAFGGKYVYNKSYVAIINVGTGTEPVYTYYLASQDTKGYAIPLTEETKLKGETVIANARNKMEVTIQALCGSKEGVNTSLATISGLEDVQPVDEDGNKINWNATIFSGSKCALEESEDKE